MLKKIFSSVVAISFLVNTVSYADALTIRNRSNTSLNTLATQSRLSSMTDPQALDAMKLTAAAIQQQSKKYFGLLKQADLLTLPPRAANDTSNFPSTKLARRTQAARALAQKRGFVPFLGYNGGNLYNGRHPEHEYQVKDLATQPATQAEVLIDNVNQYTMDGTPVMMDLTIEAEAIILANLSEEKKIELRNSGVLRMVNGHDMIVKFDGMAQPELGMTFENAGINCWNLKKCDIESIGRLNIPAATLKLLDKQFGESKVKIGYVMGAYSLAQKLMGNDFFMDTVAIEGEEKKRFDTLMHYCEDFAASYAQYLIANGADVIAILDPTPTGNISPDHFEKNSVDVVNRLSEIIHAGGALCCYHPCKIKNKDMRMLFMERMAKAKVDILSVDAIFDLAKMYNYLVVQHTDNPAGMPILIGNISTEHSMPIGSVMEVRNEVEKLCAEMGNRPFIIGSSCDIVSCPEDNMRSLATASLAKQTASVDARDKVTEATAPKGLVRPGDEIVFDHRHKVIMEDTEFVPCWIKGIQLGDTDITTRHYLCRANKVAEGKYDYEFIPDGSKDLKGKTVAEAIKNNDILKSLVKKSSPQEVKDGIDRFVKHQSKGLIIASAILAGEEERMTVEKYPFLGEAQKFLAENGLKSAASFEKLLRWRQIMKISDPEIDMPEAGGIGIYFPANKPQYENVETALHEHFAKCGMSHPDVDKMIAIYAKLKNQIVLELPESELLERAKQLDYENRYGDLLNMDFNAQVAPEIEVRRAEQIERLGLRNPGHTLSLGANVSTQGIIFTLVSGDGEEVVYSSQETYDKKAYEEYGASPGYVESIQKKNTSRYVTNPLMIAAAFQNSMKALGEYCRAKGIDTSNIKVGAISVMQHMTVYLKAAAEKGFVAGVPILQQLKDGKYLTGPEGGMSPMWKDESTGPEGEEIAAIFGGKDELRNRTGSGFQERFPAGQIRKFAKDSPQEYAETKWILNGAAYINYLLTGKICPWDEGDGIPSHLVDVRTKKLLPAEILDQIAPDLSKKLSGIEPTATIVGTLHEVWLEDLPGAGKMKIGNSSGDNPSGSVGFGLFDDTKVAVSLGSSGVIEQIIDNLGKLDAALKGEPIGSIMGTPFGAWMRLVCFQNSAQALTEMRDEYIKEDEAVAYLARSGTTNEALAAMSPDDRNKMIFNAKWLIFEEVLKETPAGNNGAMMILQNKKEAAVDIMYRPGQYFSVGITDFSVKNRAQVLRAAVEGQIYFLKWVADHIGLQVKEINLTGGEARNASIRQMVADIFGVPVNVLAKNELWDTENVSLGAALTGLKAHNDAVAGKDTGWDFVPKIVRFSGEPIQPSANAAEYKKLLPAYGELVEGARRETEIAATPFPQGIDETLLDLAGADVSAQNTVVFVAQEFASLERCEELFPHVTFVPFSKSDSLPDKLNDSRYAARNKVLITFGLNADEQMQSMIEHNRETFESVIPINVGAECFNGLTSLEQKPFQKGILTMGLLASAIPKDKGTYKTARSYTVLEALLNMVFEDEATTREYIDNLVNPNNEISVITRWGYLIGRWIGPVKKNTVNVFMRIVNYFA